MNKLPDLEELENELASREYYECVAKVHGEMFKHGKHIKYVSENTQKFLNDEMEGIDVLLISMPPQHGKSMSVTETLPFWWLGKNPEYGIITLSYGDDLAKKFGKKNRQKLQEFGKSMFNLEIAKDQASILDFGIEGHRGFIKSAGIMSGVTGNNADLIIVDDPIKNRQEAESNTYRDRVWEEFQDTVNSRLSAHGKVIVIQTRWHEDDLIGRVKANFKGMYFEINIPLEAEENDILGRNKGDSLFPEIGKDKEWLGRHKKKYLSESGQRSWNSLYQGKPTGKEGNLFRRKWFKYIKKDDLPAIKYKKNVVEDYYDGMINLVMSVDATFKDADSSDNVSIQILGKRGPDIYILKDITEKMDFTTTLDTIRTLKLAFPKIQAIYIEDKANGSAIINVLSKEISGIIPIEPYGGKIARAQAVQPTFRSGNVYLVQEEWNIDYVDELCAFPNGKHDDRVDSCTQGLNQLIYYTSDIPVEKKRDEFREMMQREESNESSEMEIDASDFEF